MRRVRFVLCGRRGALGGSERIADGIEAALAQAGWEVDWLCPADLPRVPESRRYPGLNTFLASWAVTRAARRLGAVDLTYSHGAFGHGLAGPRVHLFHGTFRGLAEACRAGLPGPDYWVVSRVNGWLERQSGRGATGAAVSRMAADEARRWYGLPGLRVIHNAVDAAHFRPLGDPEEFRGEWGLPVGRRLLLVVGRMDFGKGREVVRALLSRLPVDVGVVFAAPAHSGLDSLPADRIHVLPGVAYGDLPRLYAAADAVLCPSLYEGFAMTPIEAWACGRPVVSTPVGVVRELRDDPHLAPYVAAAADPEALAAAAEQLLTDRAAARDQAAWGRSLVEDRFCIARFAAEHRDLCEKALAS
jgi:glycosyltransferase involved in cell wall biosynthesis